MTDTRSSRNLPYPKQTKVRCQRCGRRVWRLYLRKVSTTWEHTCEDCTAANEVIREFDAWWDLHPELHPKTIDARVRDWLAASMRWENMRLLSPGPIAAARPVPEMVSKPLDMAAFRAAHRVNTSPPIWEREKAA